MARVLIATDAWHPQVSGVVRTLDTTARVLREWGHAVEVIEPTGFPQFAVPFYPEIPFCATRPGRVYERIYKFRPDHIHISTEGPLGFWVRQQDFASFEITVEKEGPYTLRIVQGCGKGSGGAKVAFVHPKAMGGVLVELVEP